MNEGSTVEEALEYASTDKSTLDKYLSMSQEETEDFVKNEVNELFKSK